MCRESGRGRWGAGLVVLAWMVPAVAWGAAPPSITAFQPAGAQRGTTTTVRSIGKFTDWPTSVVCSRSDVTVTPIREKRGEFQIQITPTAAPGLAWIRCYDPYGATSLRPFLIGTLREVNEIEPNDRPVGQSVFQQPHLVVNGVLSKKGDVDGFVVLLRKGETLTAHLQANSGLGSPIDPLLQVCRLHDHGGKLEAYVIDQNLDTTGLDPRLTVTAEEEGRYLVRVMAFPSEPGQEIAYTGNDNSVYRLTLTTKGFVDFAIPMSINAQQPTAVTLHGVRIPDPQRQLVIPGGQTGERLPVVEFAADFASVFELGVVDLPVTTVDRSRTTAVTLPALVSGVLEPHAPTDVIPFEGKSGQPLHFKLESRSLGFQTSLSFQITDQQGKSLAQSESRFAARDPELQWTPPANGVFHLKVFDAFRRARLRNCYQISITTPKPEFQLATEIDRITLEIGKPLDFPITIERKQGFPEPVEITVVGLPAGVSGGTAISLFGKETAGRVVLKLEASSATVPASQGIQIIGRASGKGAVERRAMFSTEIPLTPRQSSHWLTIARAGTVDAPPVPKK